MALPDTATPATALCGKPAPDVDRFAGEIDNHNNPTLTDIQARRLTRLFAMSYATAATVAKLAYAVAP
jgi:hypothetical protein